MTGVLDGFSPAGAGYLRFTGAIDPTHAPGDAEGLASTRPRACSSSTSIPTSPGARAAQARLARVARARGRLLPARHARVHAHAGLPAPPPHALRPRGHRRAQAAKPAAPSRRARRSRRWSGSRPPPRRPRPRAPPRPTLAPAIAEIEAAGVAARARRAPRRLHDRRSHQGAHRRARRRGQHHPGAHGRARPSGRSPRTTTDYDEYQGRYGPSPNYQAGNIPFVSYGDGGQLRVQERRCPSSRAPSTCASPSRCPRRAPARCRPTATPSCSTRTAPAATGAATSTTAPGACARPALPRDDGRRPDLPGRSARARRPAATEAQIGLALLQLQQPGRRRAPTAGRAPSTRCSARACSPRAT